MYAKQFITSTKDVQKKDTKTLVDEITKGTLTGAGIGASVGMFIAFSQNKSLLMGALIGSIIGGGISRVFIVK